MNKRFRNSAAMSDTKAFSVSLEEHGRHECAATILMGLLYPDSRKPDGTLDTLYASLCGYLLRVSSEHSEGWAEERQLLRPIHAFTSAEQIQRTQRDIQTRLPKALWAGLVARELLTGVRSLGYPEPARKTVAPIAEDMAGYLKMSASNLKARAWRPWARSAHLCTVLADLHVRGVQESEPTFRLMEFLIGSDTPPLAFATAAQALEDAVANHPKIPATHRDLFLIRITEKGS
tara:strand:- start:53945 stop:54643 length:699 start_codon:yes stop_codon:yes gene_type:complete